MNSSSFRSSYWLRSLLFIGAMSLIASCSSKKKEDELYDEYANVSVEQLYNNAHDEMDQKHFKKSVEMFEAVEQQHPYSEWATRAQVMAAYANYQQEEYDAAIAILERFVRQHPGNENVAYSYYLLALCYYEQISDVGREQSMTEKALKALQDVVNRFPDTEYGRSASLKLDLVRDHLAGKEMDVGRYYLRKGDVLAAINRFKFVVDNYQITSHTPEALHRLVECYLTLGVTEEAKRYAAVLGYNYPDSSWYKDSYTMMQPLMPKQPEKAVDANSAHHP